MSHYVISLCHTHAYDAHITFWCSDNAGYCYSEARAGIYTDETLKEGYHNSEGNMPIKIEDAKKLFIELELDGEQKRVIPNHKIVWRALGVKMTKNGLLRVAK